MTATVNVPLRIANAQAVSEGRPRIEVRKALTLPGKFGRPWAVVFCEVSPLEVATVANNHGFGTVQHGRPGSPQAGVAICHDRDHATRLHDVRYKVGSPATSEGGGIRERGILTERYSFHDGNEHARHVDVSAIHVPPERADNAQADFMAAVRQTGGVVGGDFNETVRVMERTTDRLYVGVGVLGAIIPGWIEASDAWAVDIDSDHDGVDILLRIPVRRG